MGWLLKIAGLLSSRIIYHCVRKILSVKPNGHEVRFSVCWSTWFASLVVVVDTSYVHLSICHTYTCMSHIYLYVTHIPVCHTYTFMSYTIYRLGTSRFRGDPTLVVLPWDQSSIRTCIVNHAHSEYN